MQFAYLKRLPFKHGEELRQDDLGMMASPIALSKARSLLWYLGSKGKLHSAIVTVGEQSFRFYTRSNQIITLPFKTELDADVAAVIPLLYMAPVWDQPGYALIRNDVETNILFTAWLSQSGSWYASHPAKLAELEQHFQ